jgi:hypothetical protein
MRHRRLATGGGSRVKRRLFNLAAAVSLALCVATAALWALSHHKTFRVAYGRGEASYQIRASDGVILVGCVMLADGWSRQGFAVGSESDPFIDGWLRWPEPTLMNRVGFGLILDGSTRRAAPWDIRMLMFPHWAVLLMFATIVVRKVIQARVRGRTPGSCPTCGYDLRATPERCPECGTAVAPKLAEVAA